jgi:predicted ribosomally synthesized peptide with SipW-like signal peptide
MSDKKFELSRRNALIGLGTVGVASAGTGMGTSAYFSDEESFQENVLSVGELDLYVHYNTSVDQGGAETGSTTESDTIQGDPAVEQYVIDDVKPGDSGHLQFCFSVVDNPAFLRMSGELTANDENDYTEPEPDTADAGDVNDPSDSGGEGELADTIEATLSYCDEETTLRSGSLRNVLSALRVGVPLDGDPSSEDRMPFDGGESSEEPTDDICVCIDWEVPTDVGNEIQTDSVGFDLSFYGEQSRHNDGVDLASGLVGYWPLDTVEDGVAEDVSGNGNDGTVVGDVSSVDGQVAKAGAFDGDDDYVEIDDDTSLGVTNVTVSAWVYRDGSKNRSYVVDGRDHNYGIKLEDGTGKPLFFVMAPDSDSLTASQPIPDQTWTHVAGTYDGSDVKLYIDGTIEKTGGGAGDIDTSSGEARIGDYIRDGYSFQGQIDDVRIYDRALSEAEVAEIYDGTS